VDVSSGWQRVLQEMFSYGNDKGQASKDVISIGGRQTPLKSREEIWLWCIDCYGELCAITVPNVAFQKLDAEATKYSERHSVIATTGCIGVDTESMSLVLAVASLRKFRQLTEVAGAVHDRELPANFRDMAVDLFAAARFVESENDVAFGVAVKLITEQAEEEELFTQLPGSKQAKIYHTCLLMDEPKPYSAEERAILKHQM